MKNSAIAVNQESSLLLTLEEISQLVSHCHDPQETLTNIAQLIQGRFRTDVCSVYLIDPQGGDLVLAATVGLNPSSVGNVQMRFDEGLTGLVAERMAPVMESDAPAHPRFKYFQEAGEDPFHSFLGVPIIEAGAAEGVLVVQTTERRPFSPNEIRMLVTAASQLTPLVTGARLLEQVTGSGAARRAKSGAPAPTAASIVYGRGLSPGRGVGLAYVIDDQLETTVASSAASYDPAVEKGRLTSAVEAAREEIARLSRRISLLVGEDHGAILQAQLMILQDRSVERDLDSRLDAGDSAESAVSRTLDRYVARFAKMTNPFFQERIFDIKDVFRRIAWHLRPRDEAVVAGDRLILVSREASVLDLFSVDLDRLAGMVVEHGGPQSHAGIMARSLGVPMVGQVPCLLDHVQSGRRIAVDGGAGSLDLNPSPIATPTARAVSASVAFLPPSLRIAPAFSAEDDADVQAQAAPTGGPRVEANVNLLGEAGRVVLEGAAGVGLYRSEMIFLARRTLPTEEEQVEIYRKLIDAVRGRPVTIRTFDLRPDKLAHGSVASQALDWRLVLEAPALQRLFREQVRAILRAATGGPVRLLVPLVNRSALLDFALETIQEARRELAREGTPHGRDVPIGAMIEVAAVAPLIGDWAERVDFFSMGTNDLTASALGQDRDDPVGGRPDDLLHPGLVRLIGSMIEAAHAGGRTVSVCGEMAADPAGSIVLAALGADSLSVAVDRVQPVRGALAALTPAALAETAALLRRARCNAEVERAVRPYLPT